MRISICRGKRGQTMGVLRATDLAAHAPGLADNTLYRVLCEFDKNLGCLVATGSQGSEGGTWLDLAKAGKVPLAFGGFSLFLQ